MKSKDLQKVVPSKYQNSDTTTKIHRDLNGRIGLRIIKRWCQIIRQYDSIKLSSPSDDPRFTRTKGNIQKVNTVYAEKRLSARELDGAWYFREKCSANNEK